MKIGMMKNMNGQWKSSIFREAIKRDAIVATSEIGDRYACTYGCPVNS